MSGIAMTAAPNAAMVPEGLAVTHTDVWMGEPSLPAEFRRALGNRTQGHLDWLYRHGVGFTARDRAGGVGLARIVPCQRTFIFDPSGFPALILAAWQPWAPSLDHPRAQHWISDLVAFRLQDPFTYWFRIGHENRILAPRLYDDALETGEPVPIYDNPGFWLLGGCDGPCFLDDAGETGGAA